MTESGETEKIELLRSLGITFGRNPEGEWGVNFFYKPNAKRPLFIPLATLDLGKEKSAEHDLLEKMKSSPEYTVFAVFHYMTEVKKRWPNLTALDINEEKRYNLMANYIANVATQKLLEAKIRPLATIELKGQPTTLYEFIDNPQRQILKVGERKLYTSALD